MFEPLLLILACALAALAVCAIVLGAVGGLPLVDRAVRKWRKGR